MKSFDSIKALDRKGVVFPVLHEGHCNFNIAFPQTSQSSSVAIITEDSCQL